MSRIATLLRTTALTTLFVFASPLASALEPTDAHREVAGEIADSLRYGHYADMTLDDAWSRRAFDRYLNNLDGQRSFLLASDIAEFQDLETSLDDQMIEGNLERAFALHARTQDRQKARLNQVLEQIDQGIDMAFDSDRELLLDREEEDWASGMGTLDTLWSKRLENAALSLALADQDEDDITDTLRTRYESQLNRIEQTEPEDVFGILMNAVTGTADPHTGYLSPRQGESFDIQMSLSLEGIGALLQADGEYVKISSLVPGGPADRAGELQPADRIVAVGQEDEDERVNVVGMRLDNVVDLIRGPKGSVVTLEVIPAQAVDITRTRTLSITRDTVDLEDQAASSDVIEVEREGGVQKVGVITVPTFYVDFEGMQAGEQDYRSTTRDVAAEITALVEDGVEGIVLDLRDNGGGALQEANSLIGLFIDRGPTVQVRDADGRIQLYGNSQSGTLYDGPLTVLVNRLSASASEIFAGAIQDYGRGLVLGSQTFGKGTVQTLNELSQGEIKLTRAKFYRVTGDSTQNRGVQPDLPFPDQVDPERIGESALDNALPWDKVQDVRYRRYGNPQAFLGQLSKQHEKRISQDPNFRYMEQQSTLTRELREQQTRVSLNLEKRRLTMQAQEAEQLALENTRRMALGKDAIENWDLIEDDSDDMTSVEAASIIEAAHITIDYARLAETQMVER